VNDGVESAPASRRPLTRALRLCAVAAVFGLAGPPIGGLVAWAMMGAPTLRSPVPFVGGSYGEGVVLALATGTMVAAAAWFGKSSWIVAVTAAIAANLAFHIGTLTPDLSTSEQIAALLRTGGVFLPPSIAAAILCWLIVRPLTRIR
jgi:hypothetical protein